MIPNKTFILENCQQIKKIGEGLTSTVYKAIHSQLGQVCLKVIHQKFYSKAIGKSLVDNEVRILKQLNHKNLLKLRKYQQNEKQNIIITDFCQGGNLYDLSKKCKKFSEQQTLDIVQGIVNGLSQLYKKNIIHRDLKPQNIFFKEKQPIIADFGFAVHLDNNKLFKINAGSPLYMAPETLQSLNFSIESDIFSLGVIMYEMLVGNTPWRAISEQELLKNLLTIKPKLEIKNKKLEKLIIKCLQPKKQSRAKFSQIVDFIRQFKKPLTKPLISLNDIKNIQIKSQIKNKKDSKSYKLNLNLKSKNDKQNLLNLTLNNTKTHRNKENSIEINRSCKNHSLIIQKDQIKTKRYKSQKVQIDFWKVLNRLDPQQMRFLPHSMIQKFKFILNCYSRILQHKSRTVQKDIPKGLKNDKGAGQIANCSDQKQLCHSISSYIGRMYRLAKNYKIEKEFMKDIEYLYYRVQSFC